MGDRFTTDGKKLVCLISCDRDIDWTRHVSEHVNVLFKMYTGNSICWAIDWSTRMETTVHMDDSCDIKHVYAGRRTK